MDKFEEEINEDSGDDFVGKMDFLEKLRSGPSFGQSYSIRKIDDWMQANNFDGNAYSTSRREFATGLYDTAMRLILGENKMLSIQTDSTVSGPAFAETCLLNSIGELIEEPIRWDEQEELFDYLLKLREKYPLTEPLPQGKSKEEKKKESTSAAIGMFLDMLKQKQKKEGEIEGQDVDGLDTAFMRESDEGEEEEEDVEDVDMKQGEGKEVEENA